MSVQTAQKSARDLKREKEESKLRSLKPDLSTKMVLQNHNVIRDYGKIIVVGQSGVPVADFTICHPIGVHRLPEKTWVMGYSEDIHAGLQRLKDPVQDRIDADRFKIQVELLSSAGLVKAEDPYEVIWEEMNVPYSIWKDAATARMNAENEKQKALHEQKFKDFKGQKPKFRPERNVEKFFSKKESGFSLQVMKVFTERDYESLARTRVPQVYQTEFGKGKKFPQPEIKLNRGFIPEKNTLTSVLDEIQRRIYEEFVNPNFEVSGIEKHFEEDPRKKVETLGKTNEALMQKIKELEAALHSKKTEVSGTDEYIEDLREENVELKNQLEEAQNDCDYYFKKLEVALQGKPEEWQEILAHAPSKVGAEGL